MTPQQALNNLYLATRQMSLPAEQHELLAKSAQVLQEALAPPAETPPAE